MAASSLSAVSFAAILALTVPSLAFGGDLRLIFLNGRVTLVARDVPLREILAEWERAGDTSVVNRDAAPGVSLTIEFADVPEKRALATLLRQAAGYIAIERSAPGETSSRFARIVIMPGGERWAAAAPAGAQPLETSAGLRAGGRLQAQLVMPDGRVVSIMEDPARPIETSIVEEEEEIPQLPVVEPPVNLAIPFPPAAAAVPVDGNQVPGLPPAARGSGDTTRWPARAAPTVPGAAATPGVLVPGSKPELTPYRPQELPPPPPPPIKLSGV